MAPLAKSLALAGSLWAALSAAAPVNKRGNVVVYETATTVVWTTVDVTTTVYGAQPTTEAPAPPPTTVVSVTQVTPTETPEPVQAPQPEETQPAPTTTAAPTIVVPVPPQPTVPVQEPSTSEAQPTTTAAPTTSIVQPEPQPQPTQSVPSTGGSGYSGACSQDSPCTGQVTFYDTATSASAPSSCGTTNDGESENVLALPVGIMKDTDCGRTVTIKYGGITKTGKVVDKCMGCDNTSIDLSRHFFSELAAFAEGRLFGVEWWME